MRKVLALCLLACAPRAAHADNLAFTRLCSGLDAVYGAKNMDALPKVVIARDREELRRIWAEDVRGTFRGAKEIPGVPWRRYFVLAVFFGARPLPASPPQILEIDMNGRTLEVRLEEYVPPDRKAPPGPSASPYVMVACDRSGIPAADLRLLRLLDPDRRLISERTAWLSRRSDTGPDAVGKGRAW